MNIRGLAKGLAIGLLCVAVDATAEGPSPKKAAPKPEAKAPAAEPNKVAPMDQPLVKVEGQIITSRDYASFLQMNPQIISKAFDSEQGKAAAIREMVSVYLLRKAMYDEGLLAKEEKDPSAKLLSEAYEKLAEKHFPQPPMPHEAAGFAYYQAHESAYGIPAMLRLSEIQFKFAKGADEKVQATVRERAEKALKRLEAGEAFESVAVELTENPIGKVTRGDIGFAETGKQPWLDEALKSLQPGERTGLVKAETGYYIFKLTDTRKGLVSPYANVREAVIKAMREEEQKKLRDAYVKTLAQKSSIEITMPSIQQLYPKGMFE
jgi:parvulin-like peptidyl-prolyl isomerase